VRPPPPATIPGKAITERRIGFAWENNSKPVTSHSFHEKLLNIYGIGVAVSLALIGFGVWCHFAMDAIIRFLPVCAGLTIGLYYR
jgi:hypothetical protein